MISKLNKNYIKPKTKKFLLPASYTKGGIKKYVLDCLSICLSVTYDSTTDLRSCAFHHFHRFQRCKKLADIGMLSPLAKQFVQ